LLYNNSSIAGRVEDQFVSPRRDMLCGSAAIARASYRRLDRIILEVAVDIVYSKN